MNLSIPFRLFVALRAALWATAFVVLWTWLAISVRPLDLGLPLSLPSWIRLPGLAALFLLIAQCFVLLYEEPSLTARFGDPYLRYKASVRRWLPRVRKLPGLLLLAGSVGGR